jgi:hypothetical protein
MTSDTTVQETYFLLAVIICMRNYVWDTMKSPPPPPNILRYLHFSDSGKQPDKNDSCDRL